MSRTDLPAEKLYDVLVVGELNVDLILNEISQFPVIGKEVLANTMTLTLGSSSAIFASNLSTLGSRVAFVGKLGRDDFGDSILKTLDSRGVNTSFISSSADYSTGATIVLNFGEDRAMVTHPGAMNYLTLEDVPHNVMQQARHLHLSSVFLQQGIKNDVIELFARAKACGLTTSMDPQWDPAEKWDIDFRTLLQYVDVFIPNANELQAITGVNDIALAAKAMAGKNILVVKNGREGAYLWHNDEFLFQPAFLNRDVVDSIGAGDSFDAGFIHQYLQQKTLKTCLEFAALTGAVNTTRPGGTTAFENIHTVKNIAEISFNYIF